MAVGPDDFTVAHHEHALVLRLAGVEEIMLGQARSPVKVPVRPDGHPRLPLERRNADRSSKPTQAK
jgi:hypothetical protein